MRNISKLTNAHHVSSATCLRQLSRHSAGRGVAAQRLQCDEAAKINFKSRYGPLLPEIAGHHYQWTSVDQGYMNAQMDLVPSMITSLESTTTSSRLQCLPLFPITGQSLFPFFFLKYHPMKWLFWHVSPIHKGGCLHSIKQGGPAK